MLYIGLTQDLFGALVASEASCKRITAGLGTGQKEKYEQLLVNPPAAFILPAAHTGFVLF